MEIPKINYVRYLLCICSTTRNKTKTYSARFMNDANTSNNGDNAERASGVGPRGDRRAGATPRGSRRRYQTRPQANPTLNRQAIFHPSSHLILELAEIGIFHISEFTLGRAIWGLTPDGYERLQTERVSGAFHSDGYSGVPCEAGGVCRRHFSMSK